jgi:hypothetical protein
MSIDQNPKDNPFEKWEREELGQRSTVPGKPVHSNNGAMRRATPEDLVKGAVVDVHAHQGFWTGMVEKVLPSGEYAVIVRQYFKHNGVERKDPKQFQVHVSRIYVVEDWSKTGGGNANA